MIELTKEESEKRVNRVRVISETWDELCKSHNFCTEFAHVCYLSIPILYELTYRYIADVRRIRDYHKDEIFPIDEYKISGYLSYWICKLRPVQHEARLKRFTRTQSLLNEELAFHVSISRINEERAVKGLPRIDFHKDKERGSSFINNLFYTMKFRLTTGDNLAQIYQLTKSF